MNKILLAGTALISLIVAGSASAADLPNRRAPAPYVPVFTWTGFYAGVNAGYAFSGDSKLKDVDVNYYGYSIYPLDTVTDSSDDGSFTGGAQIGYNYQIGSFVIGAEADFNYADIQFEHSGREDFMATSTYTGAYTVDAKAKVEWFGTVRARLGFTPIDRLLVFATGGLAYGNVKTDMNFVDYFGGGIDASFSESKSDTRFGWTIGAGLEYAITDHLTVKGEYAYVDLGDKTHSWTETTINLFGRASNHYMTAKDEAAFHIVRAGLNYKF